MTWLQIWIALRALRWFLWLAMASLTIEFLINRSGHLTQFGHLRSTTELWMFSLPVAAVFMGFFELAARERTGHGRPAFLRNWTG